VNVVLIIVAVAILVLLVVANVFLLVHFQSPDDKMTAWFPKILVLVGMTLTEAIVLMLPLDVSNTETDGGIPTDILWEVIYIALLVVSLGLMPFGIFYYEAADPANGSNSNWKQIRSAVVYEFIILVIFTAISVILWATIGVAEIPVVQLTSPLMTVAQVADINNVCAGSLFSGKCNLSNEIVSTSVTFILYLMTMMSFLGLFLLVLFGGIGFSSIPMDFFIGYKYRPKKISREKYVEEKNALLEKCQYALSKAKEYQQKWSVSNGRPRGQRQRRTYNEFRAIVDLLEEDLKRLKKSYGETGKGPLFLAILWGYMQLPLAFLTAILSILWIVHIFLWMATYPPISPFLNIMFIALDQVFGLFGTAMYGLFSMYLLFCVLKGNFKFGLRIPFIFAVHPMRPGETTMNSFMFNVMLLMIASVTVVGLCATAFSLYARLSAIDVIYNIGVKNMKGIKYVWRYYQWGIFGVALITLIWLLIWPSDQKANRAGFKSAVALKDIK